MPWKAVGNKIVRADTGKVVGKSKSHEKAQAAVRARYANMPKMEKMAEEMKKKGCGSSCA